MMVIQGYMGLHRRIRRHFGAERLRRHFRAERLGLGFGAWVGVKDLGLEP